MTEAKDLKAKKMKTEGFEAFLEDPMTRFGMASIPPGDHLDALRLILQSAFNHGFAVGGAHMATELLEKMMPKRRKREEDF